MRASEFIIESSQVELRHEFWSDGTELHIEARIQGKVVGSVDFVRPEPMENDNVWEPENVTVDEKFRRGGIATAMYNLAKKLVKPGYIVPSPNQSDDGKSLWKNRQVWEQGVAEGEEINREVEDLVQQVDFIDIVYKIAREKYPKVPFEMSRDDMVTVNAPDGQNDTFSDDYEGFLVMGMTYSSDLGDEVGVLITNAYTGPYKGILLPAIKLATEKCLQLVPGSTPKLWAGEDESDGAWSHIAQKLGYKFEVLNEGKQGVAEGLNEFAPDGFNGGDDDEGFSPEIAKMAQEDGFTKGVSLADGATLERAITINYWHSQHGGMYRQYFVKGFRAGRLEKIRHDNKRYNLNLKLMKDGSIRHSEQGIAENFADGRKFVEPNFDFEWEEAERYPEFVKLGKDTWIKLARKGKAVTINSAKGISNTDAGDPDSFKLLHPEKQKRALAQLEKGTVEMPIVAVYSDGHKELIGGNTRLTAMMARDGRATVWAFRVPGKQGVAEDAVEDLEKDLKEPHSYDAIDHMMQTIAREEGITAKILHDRFVDKHSMTPDDWIKNKLAENFKDGKNPGRKGLAKRSGVNCKASASTLRRVAKNSSGEKQRMAHWCANMKSGRKK